MSNIKNPQSNPLKSSAPVRPPGGNTAPKKVYVALRSVLRRYRWQTGQRSNGPISRGHSKPAESSP